MKSLNHDIPQNIPQNLAVEYIRGEIICVEREPISAFDNTRKTRLWIVVNPVLGHGELFALPITSQICNGAIPIRVNMKDMWVAPVIKNIHIQNIIRHVAFVSPAGMQEIDNLLMWIIGIGGTVSPAMQYAQKEYTKMCNEKDNDPTREVIFNTLGTPKTAENAETIKKLRDTPMGDWYYQEDILQMKTSDTSNDNYHNHVPQSTKGNQQKASRPANATKFMDVMQSSYRAKENKSEVDNKKNDFQMNETIRFKIFKNRAWVNPIQAKVILLKRNQDITRMLFGFKSDVWYYKLETKVLAHPDCTLYPTTQGYGGLNQESIDNLYVTANRVMAKSMETTNNKETKSNLKQTPFMFTCNDMSLMSTFACALLLGYYPKITNIYGYSRNDTIKMIANRIVDLS